jgi:ribosome-binding protein aMBF1 (putative translation factor)
MSSNGEAVEARLLRRRLLMASIAERFAANLRRLRDAAGLSQEELAFRAQIHRTQVTFLRPASVCRDLKPC